MFSVLFYFLILIIQLCHLLVAPPMFNIGHGACLTAGQDYCMLNVSGVFHCLSSHFFRENFMLHIRITPARNQGNQYLN